MQQGRAIVNPTANFSVPEPKPNQTKRHAEHAQKPLFTPQKQTNNSDRKDVQTQTLNSIQMHHKKGVCRNSVLGDHENRRGSTGRQRKIPAPASSVAFI
jgi:hypothetical protein